MDYQFRAAQLSEVPVIWTILQDAIQRRKEDGSLQWQDGYPNTAVIEQDINKGHGYVLTDGPFVVGYCALLINDEPEYAKIEGQWLTNGDFVVFHRIAIATSHLGQGLAKQLFHHIEAFALQNHIHSIKADTNYDNAAMLTLFEKQGYTYCGEVYFRGSARRAFEKVLM